MTTPLRRKSSAAGRRPPVAALRALTQEISRNIERRMSATGSRPASGTVTPNIGTRDGEELSETEKRGLTALLGVQSQQEELMREMREEMLALEKKYLAKTAPLYERRASIVSGTAPPSRDELLAAHRAHANLADPSAYAELVSSISKVAVSSKPADLSIIKDGDTTRIKDFWLTAMRNHRALRLLISESDAKALRHLVDVRLSYLTGSGGFTTAPPVPSDPEPTPADVEPDTVSPKHEGELGYKLTFVFEPNEFFENDCLEKTYVYRRELDWTGNTIVDYAEGTPIRWKSEEVNFTKNSMALGHSNSNTRTAKRQWDDTSFFKFFDPPRAFTQDTQEEVSDEDVEENEFEVMLDNQLGEDFKELIIPRAVDYFSGKALEWEDHPNEWSDDETDYEDDD